MSVELGKHQMLGREQLDRDAAARSREGLVEELLAQTDTRIMLLHNSRSLVSEDALRFVSASDVPANAVFLYLGREVAEDAQAAGAPASGGAFLAAFAGAPGDEWESVATQHGADWTDLRVVGAQLSDRDAGLFTQAVALYHWHQSHPHSPKSGAPTEAAQAGWVRASVDDGSHVFPRTDPAVIVLVVDDEDRILLGNNAMWEENRFSLLAGYVEPGESLEAAVIREIFEESGLRISNPTYFGSQPWPFPGSVMMGFTARLAPGQHPEAHAADGEEILRLRWFTRDELKAAVADIKLPGRVAIARTMIEHWLGEEIDQESGWRGTR